MDGSNLQRSTSDKAVHNVLRDSLVPHYLGKWHSHYNSIISHISWSYTARWTSVGLFWGGHDPDTNIFSTFGGVAFAAQNLFNSQATQFLDLIQLNGSLASQYIDDYGTGNVGYFATQAACAMNWRDPTDDILNALNEIMFQAALAASDVSKFAFMNLSYEDTTSFYETWSVNISTRDTQVCQYLKCCKCSRRPTLQYSNQTTLI